MTNLQAEQRTAADQLQAMVKRKKPVSRRGPQLEKIRRDITKAADIAKTEQRWGEFNAPLLVALYAWLHEQVYGIDPASELIGKAGLGARKAAKTLLDTEFGGDRGEFLVFMRWVWYRERERERWRIENNRQGGRISWQYQFSPRLVNEYRVTKRRFEPNFSTKNGNDDYAASDKSYSIGT